MDRRILTQWLNAGFIDRNCFHNTRAGVLQGGVASPLLANMALDGLETAIHKVSRQKDKVNFIRYADDFIVTAKSKELLESKIKPAIEAFLAKRGLQLSITKTTIT